MKYTKEQIRCGAEKALILNLLKIYPKGILSYVSDTYNLWDVLTKILPTIKDEILSRDGKLVIRPDSGDPVDIICGLNTNRGHQDDVYALDWKADAPWKGVIELLWETFGGTVNEQGFKVLDPHIGAIHGDSTTMDRAIQICERLKAKRFASTNIVLGIGSYTYQYNTRDTFGFAMKATYGELLVEAPNGHGGLTTEIECREIFKAPVTDSGEKKSAKGLLAVHYEGQTLRLKQSCTKEQEKEGLLQTVFKDGKLYNKQTLSEIRERLNKI